LPGFFVFAPAINYNSLKNSHFISHSEQKKGSKNIEIAALAIHCQNIKYMWAPTNLKNRWNFLQKSFF